MLTISIAHLRCRKLFTDGGVSFSSSLAFQSGHTAAGRTTGESDGDAEPWQCCRKQKLTIVSFQNIVQKIK